MLVAIVMASALIVPTAAPVFAAPTSITIGTTQPVYLVNNGDTANFGVQLTTVGGDLDRDLTVTVNTGTSLTVGGSVGSTTLAGNTTIAGGSTTLTSGNTTVSAGSTTLAAAAAAGATNVKVTSTTNFAAGQTVNIDTGANLKSAVIQTVGSQGPGGTGITLTAPLTLAHASTVPIAAQTLAGSSNVKVASVTNFVASQTIAIDTGANKELAVVAAVGTTGATGTGLTLAAPLALQHSGNVAVAVVWPAGAQAVKTAAITNFGAGQTVNIDTGANLETATIATVGGGSNSTLALASAAGDTNLKVAAVTGIVAGQTLFIDAGANLKNAVVASIGNGGNTTLSAAAAAGATNIKIASTSGLTPNGTITIDAGTPDAETV